MQRVSRNTQTVYSFAIPWNEEIFLVENADSGAAMHSSVTH